MSGTRIRLTGNKGKITADFDKARLDAEYTDVEGFRATLSVPMSEVNFSADNTYYSIRYAPGEAARLIPERMVHKDCGGETEETVEYTEDGKIKNMWICKKCNQRFDFERLLAGKKSFPEDP
jgi:hypothetical protein